MAEQNPNVAEVESNASSPRPSPTRSNGVQEPESSRASQLPAYTKNAPLDDPFRDEGAPVENPSSNSDGMQKGSKAATAIHMDQPLATVTTTVEPSPPAPAADADPFAVDVVLDGSLLTPPLLPDRPSGLQRGLQIPSRVSHITWGFSFPKVLADHGVTKPFWRAFKHELKAFASMSVTQHVTVIACHLGVHYLLGPIAALIVGWKMQKHREHENFLLAYQSGAMKVFQDRWNQDYFHALGLHVRVEPPDMGIGSMNEMDVASSKLFRYQQKLGTSSPAPGLASEQADKKECKYQRKEGRYRMKAARKGRIIVLPFNPLLTGSESHTGQSEGITTMAGPSVQDFAFMDQRQSGLESLDRTNARAQRLSWPPERRLSSENLYRGHSDHAERVPSLARSPTTHWGGNR